MKELTELISVDDLLPGIYAKHCITKWHFDSIKAELPQFEKTIRLLRIMFKRSQVDYDNFSNALESIGQGHVARVLREGGGMLRLLPFWLGNCWLDSGFFFVKGRRQNLHICQGLLCAQCTYFLFYLKKLAATS